VLHATAAIERDPDHAGVAHYRHVIVDEAQDLVGVRLAFIEALLAASTAASLCSAIRHKALWVLRPKRVGLGAPG